MSEHGLAGYGGTVSDPVLPRPISIWCRSKHTIGHLVKKCNAPRLHQCPEANEGTGRGDERAAEAPRYQAEAEPQCTFLVRTTRGEVCSEAAGSPFSTHFPSVAGMHQLSLHTPWPAVQVCLFPWLAAWQDGIWSSTLMSPVAHNRLSWVHPLVCGTPGPSHAPILLLHLDAFLGLFLTAYQRDQVHTKHISSSRSLEGMSEVPL